MWRRLTSRWVLVCAAVVVLLAAATATLIYSWYYAAPLHIARLQSQDLMLGLACFAFRHEGRLPISEAEFRHSEFVRGFPDGSLQVEVPSALAHLGRSRGSTISGLSDYSISWGGSLESFLVDECGITRDRNGSEAKPVLFRFRGSERTEPSRWMSAYLVNLYRLMVQTRALRVEER